MTKENNETPVTLNMGLDEALERLAGTDPEEVRDVAKVTMSPETIDDLIDAFESRAHVTDEGDEFWYARDLQELFEYDKWERFEGVIGRAMTACANFGQPVEEHFEEVFPTSGKNSEGGRPARNFHLSRYASYLAAQNADSRKKPVAFAQTYFAIQTRRQEKADAEKAMPRTEDEKRLFLRNEIVRHNKYLSSAAKGAGIETSKEFAIFHSHGYKGLYGMTKAEIQRHKGLKSSVNILDRMGSTELAANFFRVTQTEEKLRKEGIKGKSAAYDTHYAVGRKVREAMLEISGTAPENLPVADDIKAAKKRIGSIQEKAVNQVRRDVPKPDASSSKPGLQEIDLKADLWKFALLVLVQQPDMAMSTTDLIAELPNYITVPDEVDAANMSRKDSKFSQLVRNLKSHKTSKSNFIYLGYAEDIKGGFRATEKGRQFVLTHFLWPPI